MSRYRFGEKSMHHLYSAHPVLIMLAKRVLSYGVMDFSVIEGHRSTDRQQQLFKEGKTHIDGFRKLGKHNQMPSLAIDVLPYPQSVNGVKNWDDRHRFCVLAGMFFAAAAELDIANHGFSLRWGGDWDGDGNNQDSNFDDLPHFELVSL